MDIETLGTESYSLFRIYRGIEWYSYSIVCVLFFMQFFLYSVLVHDDHPDLYGDLKIVWQSVMWSYFSNITGLARIINNIARWQRTLFRLGFFRKNKCWVTLCLYNACHYNYIYWNNLNCIFVTINYLLFSFIRGQIASASTLVWQYWWPRYRTWAGTFWSDFDTGMSLWTLKFWSPKNEDLPFKLIYSKTHFFSFWH